MNYLRTYTLGRIIRDSFAIYFRNFFVILAVFLIPHLPVQLIKLFNTNIYSIILDLTDLIVSFISIFPITVVISEICLAIRPNIARAYSRGFSSAGPAIGAILLSGLIIIGGFILLFIPGIIFSVWYFFVAQAVILEGKGGRAALIRSRELGRGHYLRNFGVVAAMLFIVELIVISVALLLGVIIGYTVKMPIGELRNSMDVMGNILAYLLLPPYQIALVLLYYDMRVRKEGYGAAQLTEDLNP
jgi:hypothetical protein